MGLIAKLEQRNADLEKRVETLEAAFEGLRQYCHRLLDERTLPFTPFGPRRESPFGDLKSCFFCGEDHNGLPCPRMAPRAGHES